MNRLVLNGSPRGRQSNSRTAIDWITAGMREAGGQPSAVLDLARRDDLDAQRRAFLEADEVLLVFPLYTDSVPGIVMHFLEGLTDADPARLHGKRFAFVVHSGFPEAVHSEAVSAWLERLARRWGMVLAGSAVKGMSESFRMMPEQMLKKTRDRFTALGRSLVLAGTFDAEAVRALGRPHRLRGFGLFILRVLLPSGLLNTYWKMQLKKHGAWKRRFDRPYEAEKPAGA